MIVNRTLFMFALVLASLAQAQDIAPDRTPSEWIATLSNADASKFEKAKACQQLAVIGNGDAADALVGLLSDPELSVYALTALQRIPGQDVDRLLIDCLDTTTGRPLTGLLHTIGQRKIKQAVEKLAALVLSDQSDDDVRAAAIRSLGRIGGPQALAALQKIKKQSISRRDQRVLRDALLQATAAAPADLESLAKKLSSADDATFRSALYDARQIGPAASPLVADQLQNLSPSRQALALICLADLGDHNAAQSAQELVAAKDSQVALRAVQTTTKLDGWGNDPQLPHAAMSRSDISRPVAHALASAANPRFDESVLTQLRQIAAGERHSAAFHNALLEYVSVRRLSDATDLLIEMGRSGPADSRASALAAIGGTMSMEQLPAVLQAFATDELTADSDLKAKILDDALVKLPRDRAAAAIEKTMNSSAADTQLFFLKRLGFLGGDKALQIVAKAARSKDEASVDAATQVLGEWLSADVADVLLSLARELPEGKYQLRALRGYLRVGRQLAMPMPARIKLCQNGYELAQRDDERLLVLEILRRYPSAEGHRWLKQQMSQEKQPSRKLQNQQQATLQRLAERL